MLILTFIQTILSINTSNQDYSNITNNNMPITNSTITTNNGEQVAKLTEDELKRFSELFKKVCDTFSKVDLPTNQEKQKINLKETDLKMDQNILREFIRIVEKMTNKDSEEIIKISFENLENKNKEQKPYMIKNRVDSKMISGYKGYKELNFTYYFDPFISTETIRFTKNEKKDNPYEKTNFPYNIKIVYDKLSENTPSKKVLEITFDENSKKSGDQFFNKQNVSIKIVDINSSDSVFSKGDNSFFTEDDDNLGKGIRRIRNYYQLLPPNNPVENDDNQNKKEDEQDKKEGEQKSGKGESSQPSKPSFSSNLEEGTRPNPSDTNENIVIRTIYILQPNGSGIFFTFRNENDSNSNLTPDLFTYPRTNENFKIQSDQNSNLFTNKEKSDDKDSPIIPSINISIKIDRINPSYFPNTKESGKEFRDDSYSLKDVKESDKDKYSNLTKSEETSTEKKVNAIGENKENSDEKSKDSFKEKQE